MLKGDKGKQREDTGQEKGNILGRVLDSRGQAWVKGQQKSKGLNFGV